MYSFRKMSKKYPVSALYSKLVKKFTEFEGKFLVLILYFFISYMNFYLSTYYILGIIDEYFYENKDTTTTTSNSRI